MFNPYDPKQFLSIATRALLGVEQKVTPNQAWVGTIRSRDLAVPSSGGFKEWDNEVPHPYYRAESLGMETKRRWLAV